MEEADDDSDYDMSPATRRSEHIDHLTTSSSSLHTADGLTVSVVRGSITDQQVHASQCCVRHTVCECRSNEWILSVSVSVRVRLITVVVC